MISVRSVLFVICVAALPLLAGCSATSTTPPAAPKFVYYSTFDCTVGHAGIGVVAYPITPTSTLALTLNNSAANGLTCPAELLVDAQGRLFVINDNVTPFTIPVFSLPLSASSTPLFTLTLPAGVMDPFNMTFDASGNLWVSSSLTNQVMEFTGPFTTSTTLVPAVTIATTATCPHPDDVTFDASGNLYVACEGNPGPANAIGVFLKGGGFTNATPLDHVLDGPGHPDSLKFDPSNNLYASSILASPSGGIALYLSNNLGAAATPNVYDSTGMAAGYFPYQYTFDSPGNIYDADCGSTGHIYVYPTGTSALSTTLAPSATYTDANTAVSACVGGIAIH